MNEKLALLGGEKTITKSFSRYNHIGEEEKKAVLEVLESGVLSKFLGAWAPEENGNNDFYGGKKVQEFEREIKNFFKCQYAITVNSNTSGLIAALGAVGIEPGDEVIVSPWTMCASATSILVWNAIPIFADIEPDTFNLDPKSIESKITPRTKAIMVTDIFGQAAKLDEIMLIAKKYGLKVIEDCAQSPGAIYKEKYVGTLADIGVFSFNYHKHIHTGEGGVCVTDNADLAERLQLIRNHGEAVVGKKGVNNISNMIGFNFRMTEIEAAIGIEQLKKLTYLTAQKIRAANRLTAGLSKLKGLKTPSVQNNCTHVYYVYPLCLNLEIIPVSREKIMNALIAEGLPNIFSGYTIVYLLPMYQEKIAYGNTHFPWNLNPALQSISYNKGICPVTEKLHEHEFMGIEFCSSEFHDDEIDLIIAAFEKVWNNLEFLS